MLLWSIGRGWMCCFRAVGRLAISKMAFYMGCANASWWYRNALNAFMNVFNEFHLPYGTKRLTPRGHCANPKRHYFSPAAQGEPEQSKSNCHSLCSACVHRVCCAHRRTGLGTVCPGASGLVSRLNWITAGASAGSDEVASHDGRKVKEQPEREQRLCTSVHGRSVSDRELLRRVSLSDGVRCGEGKPGLYCARALITSTAGQSKRPHFSLKSTLPYLFPWFHTPFVILGSEE